MDVNTLIDAVVRQTTVLIAQLATAAGGRAPLAHTANQVFVDLVRELKEQGLGNKVIADMFGLALRTYHSKVRRLAESSTYQGRSLWEATLEFVQERDTVLLADVLHKFRRDDAATVRSVLTDLVESGMLFRTGRGDRTTFRAARPGDYGDAEREDTEAVSANLVWVAVNRFGPASEDEIGQAVPLERALLGAALARLVAEGRITRSESGGRVLYDCEHCVIPLGAPFGWEAAVFDHYQAVVTAICTKLRQGTAQASADDRVGGSTYGFTVWEEHPHREEVLGFLARVRTEAARLREKVTSYNAQHDSPEGASLRVIAYVGQTIIESEGSGDKS